MAGRKTNEEFINEVYELVGDEYTFLEEYINNQTNILCRHNKCGHEWKVRPNNFLNNKRCPKCYGAIKKTHKEFIKEICELVGNEYVFIEKYINASTKIKCKHIECGHIWKITPSNFLRGKRCPECKKKRISEAKTLSDDEFKARVYKLVGDEYKFLEKYEGSEIKTLCRHNKCGYEWNIRPSNFLQGNRCPKCAKKGKKTSIEFKQQVYNLTQGEYEILSEYINAKAKVKMKHNTCGFEWLISPSGFLSGNRCPYCANNIKKTHKEFVKEVHNLTGEDYEVLSEYINNRTKIFMKHNKCGYVWKVLPLQFLRGTRCPKCANNAKKTNEEFIQEVYDLVGNEYVFLEPYINDRTKIRCKHNKCGHIWCISPGKFLIGNRCPQCAESKGEQTIREYLKDNNVKFLPEYTFGDLTGVGGGLLRFDFAVFCNNDDLEFLIEYDGEFHYQDIYEDGNYEVLQIHDKRKNQYCKNNNIPLLRIPYWEFDKIEQILDKWLIKYGLIFK